MRQLIIALGATLVFVGPALAGDPPAEKAAEKPAAEAPADAAAPADAEATPAEEEMPNCAEVPEGDERTACEAKVAELMAAKAKAEAAGPDGAPKGAKGGKAARSNTNRMESEFTDE